MTWRALAVLGTGGVVVTARAGTTPAPVEQVVAAAVRELLVVSSVLVVGWALLAAGVWLSRSLPGAAGRAARRALPVLLPVAWRAAALSGVGLGVGAGSVVPAVAVDDDATRLAVTHIGGPTGGAAGDLPAVGRPVTTATPATHELDGSATGRGPRTVVVKAGESLWVVAERALGADATDAEVAAEWPRWYEANRHVIGEDPDLVLVGTRLTSPEGSDS